MTPRKTLAVVVYAPALMGEDRRTLDSVRGLERALPGLRLEWRLSKSGRPILLEQRDAWLLEQSEDGGFPLLCNGEPSAPVTVWGRERAGLLSPGGRDQFEVHAKLPLDKAVTESAASVLEGIAEGSGAYWGRATPYDAAVDIAYQMAPTPEGPPSPRRGLPALKSLEHLGAPEIPSYLGWINYWSEAAAQAIGFPDPTRDSELLARARRTPSGGWVVQLTDTPLDLDNPDHLDSLKWTYERFPAIGGRAAP
ncbi:DUF5953 family protein [Myxococcus faecalis]|uniref:DUF5953 family protein n=1 Tax=Myxococcus TaxID=32 RepID=UPI0020BD8E36|nr:DUF5953 family protein [Myxococcus fulvus]MCK8502931.1 DUF5953 family protein [Myxococcus fulvus]